MSTRNSQASTLPIQAGRSIAEIAQSVFIYLGIPFLAGYFTRDEIKDRVVQLIESLKEEFAPAG